MDLDQVVSCVRLQKLIAVAESWSEVDLIVLGIYRDVSPSQEMIDFHSSLIIVVP